MGNKYKTKNIFYFFICVFVISSLYYLFWPIAKEQIILIVESPYLDIFISTLVICTFTVHYIKFFNTKIKFEHFVNSSNKAIDSLLTIATIITTFLSAKNLLVNIFTQYILKVKVHFLEFESYDVFVLVISSILLFQYSTKLYVKAFVEVFQNIETVLNKDKNEV